MPIRAKGPQPADIMIVGEAPGKTEEQVGLPFVGSSGQELEAELRHAGIDPKFCRMTNVFMERPDGNDLKHFTGKRADVPKDYPFPPLASGQYVLPQYLDLERLAKDIRETQPKLIVALGNTACWALLARTGISKLRGNVFESVLTPGVSVLPTYHPAAVLREWSHRVVCVMDLMKARRYVVEGFSVPRRELWLDPTLADIREFIGRFIGLPALGQPLGRGTDSHCLLLSIDIETRAEQVTKVGFSPSRERSLVVPFVDPRKPSNSYWPTVRAEREAWRLVAALCECDLPKLGQNFLYDTQYLYRAPGRIRVRHAGLHDTMIRHHARYPELEKSLGFLGSIYTDEAPWKLMRKRNKESFKLEDE